MTDWFRMTENATRLWSMSIETWGASAFVIARRSAMLGNALVDPKGADLKEFGRMFPEKIDAFSKGMRDAASAEDPVEACKRALEPIHRRATSNARRLAE